MSRRGLQVTLTILGSVAAVFGAQGVLRGVGGVRNGGTASASVDSELRFFAAWYAVAGVAMVRAARRLDSEAGTLHLVCAGWLLAAGGRVLSIREVGEPDRLFQALMGVEFAIPAVIAPWHAAVAREAGRKQ